nr:hypothetical protein Iba_chr14cCG12710 [Ipomoea batatas]
MRRWENITIAIVKVSSIVWPCPLVHELTSCLFISRISSPRKANCLFPDYKTFQLLQCFLCVISANKLHKSTSFPNRNFNRNYFTIL